MFIVSGRCFTKNGYTKRLVSLNVKYKGMQTRIKIDILYVILMSFISFFFCYRIYVSYTCKCMKGLKHFDPITGQWPLIIL